jgi:hypothetical protein
MNSTMNALIAPQHVADPVSTARHDCRNHSKPRTRSDDSPTRWINLAHSTLNQAKMAAPRRAAAPSSS